MNGDTLATIRAMGSVEALVVGEAMLDRYLRGGAERLCREAPVPVVTLRAEEDQPGGAANTAANLAALGAEVRFVSAVGDDDAGRRLERALAGVGVDPADVVVARHRVTQTKTRVFADDQLVARLDQGSTSPLDSEDEADLIGRLQDAHATCDVVVVSDYGYGVLTDRVIAALRELQERHPRPLVVDAKLPERYRALGVTAVKPNYGEATRLLGLARTDHARVEQIGAHDARLLELTGARIVAATLDADGALVFERGAPPYRTYATPSPHASATGAGDTYTAALALALAVGADAPAAAEYAAAAAQVVVGKGGTTVCTAEELVGLVSADDKVVPGREPLAALARYLREQGRRIVFTNGCFDILHRGHVTYLSRAKALGDVLIVGVNGDASVRALKGPERPVNALPDRLQVLSALSCVDHVVPFGAATPDDLIRACRPDVFAKGGDYTEASLPEAPLVRELGGRVVILPYVADTSTTRIIERVRHVGTNPSPAPALRGRSG